MDLSSCVGGNWECGNERLASIKCDFWLNNEIIVLQPALFIVAYIREVMELTDAVFPFVQVNP